MIKSIVYGYIIFFWGGNENVLNLDSGDSCTTLVNILKTTKL